MTFPSIDELDLSVDPAKMLKHNLFSSDGMLVDYYLIDPGQEQRVHRHDDMEKVYYVVAGRGTFTVGEEHSELGPGQGCVAPVGVDHGVRNEGNERLVVFVVMARRGVDVRS